MKDVHQSDLTDGVLDFGLTYALLWQTALALGPVGSALSIDKSRSFHYDVVIVYAPIPYT